MKKIDPDLFNYTNRLTMDYLDQKTDLKDFYCEFPDIGSFNIQINRKKEQFSHKQRELLVKHLEAQYRDVPTSKKVRKNISLLEQSNAFTVTTGHQLNLFTGPLYFIYKIVSCLDLAERLKNEHPDSHFIPVYWMASEDHDFEEIRSAFLNNGKIIWQHEEGNAVGRMSLDGLKKTIEELAGILNGSDHSKELLEFLRFEFLNSNDHAQAFLKLVDFLFQEFGLVILDADDKALKSAFKNSIHNELEHQYLEKTVTETSKKLAGKGYKVQVNPREINLFYFDKEQRKRLVKKKNGFSTDDGKTHFTKDELYELVEEHPERFSPNVLMRPLYQETILPNLAYIGGGAEVAYWLQLKDYFEKENIPFPIIFLRNGAMVHDSKQSKKAGKLSLRMEDLLLDEASIDEKVTRSSSDIKINFEPQKKHLKQQFKDLYHIANKTDASFRGAVVAQERKQIKGLEHLEKRLLKAEKKKREDLLKRAHLLKTEFYPEGKLQERKLNFLEFYQYSGKAFIHQLVNEFNAFDNSFYIIEYNKELELNPK